MVLVLLVPREEATLKNKKAGGGWGVFFFWRYSTVY